jgi:hypothetical protein
MLGAIEFMKFELLAKPKHYHILGLINSARKLSLKATYPSGGHA